jgi:hypothetical protein
MIEIEKKPTRLVLNNNNSLSLSLFYRYRLNYSTYLGMVTKYYFNKHTVWDRDKADAKRRIQVPNNEQHGGGYACTN